MFDQALSRKGWHGWIPWTLGAVMALGIGGCLATRPPEATPAPTPAPTATAAATAAPTPTSAPTPARDAAGCPTDPREWRMVNPFPEQTDRRWLRIEPDCVYQGLAKSVAARMLIDMGWTWKEAQEALGLPRFPLRYHPVITLTGEVGGSPFYTARQSGIFSALVCDGRTPDTCPRFWQVSMDSDPPASFFLSGCFFTRDLTAGTVRDWGMPYPVVCAVKYVIRPYQWVGQSFDGKDRFRHPYSQLWVMGSEFYGYDPGTKVWLSIGIQRYSSGPEEVREGWRRTAEIYSQAYGQPIWDSRWLKEAFGLGPKPLPPGWQGWPDRMEEFYRSRYGALEIALEEWGK